MRVAALLIALVALLAVACGSTPTNDYRSKVSAVQQRYQQQLTDLTTAITTDLSTSRSAQAETDLDRFAGTVHRFATELAAIDPPDDKQALAAQLVAAYRLLERAARDLRKAVAEQNQTAVQKALGEFTAASTSESAAVDAFNAAH